MTKPKTVEEAASELLRGIAHWRNIARRNLPAWLDKYVVALFEALEAPPVAPPPPPMCPQCGQTQLCWSGTEWSCDHGGWNCFYHVKPGSPLTPPAAGAAGSDGDK